MPGPQELQEHAKELTETTGVQVEIVEEGSRVFVLLRKVRLPPGLFRVGETDILFITDQQYPLSALDMFWTEVDVVRPDGSIPQSAEAIETYLGRQWRRFSWHRNGVWNPARNGLLDHFAFVESRWVAEKRP
ncbi:MAG TPA: E2/UBC family protein [Gemmataceae bacterium]|nr:E2/UBC family protein [Gemmataceae bacterium]